MNIFFVLILLFFSCLYFWNKKADIRRIKFFFFFYKYKKIEFPNLTEGELLALVAEEHILPNINKKIKDTSITGTGFLREVFPDGVEIDELIYNLITTEFPKKYDYSKRLKASLNYKSMINSPWNKLEKIIDEQHKEILK